jgi:hypothetical protein
MRMRINRRSVIWQVAADVLGAVVEGDHGHAFEHERAEPFLHLLDRFRGGDHRAGLASGYGRDQIGEEAFAGADVGSAEQAHRRDVEGTAQHGSEHRGQRHRAVDGCLERKIYQQVVE